MIRRPPRSTLFPYTDALPILHTCLAAAVDRELTEQQPPDARPRVDVPERDAPGRERDAVAADRKSTRLNSSHANISYAVFCLKKKKKILHALPDLERRLVAIE